jgi:hypothetical protein
MDEPAAEENLKKFKRRIRKTPVMQMAAAFDVGTEKFKQAIRVAVQEAGSMQGVAAKPRSGEEENAAPDDASAS